MEARNLYSTGIFNFQFKIIEAHGLKKSNSTKMFTLKFSFSQQPCNFWQGFTCLCLSFLICKMGIIIYLIHRDAVCIKCINIFKRLSTMPGHSRILMLSTIVNTVLTLRSKHLNFHKLSLLEHTFCSYSQLNVNLLEGKLKICIHIHIKATISKFGTHLHDSFF